MAALIKFGQPCPGGVRRLFTYYHHAQAKWRWRPLGRARVCGPERTQSPQRTNLHRHVAGRRDVATTSVDIRVSPAEERNWAWQISRHLHVLLCRLVHGRISFMSQAERTAVEMVIRVVQTQRHVLLTPLAFGWRFQAISHDDASFLGRFQRGIFPKLRRQRCFLFRA